MRLRCKDKGWAMKCINPGSAPKQGCCAGRKRSETMPRIRPKRSGEVKEKILTVMVGVVAAVLLSSEQRNRRVHPEPRDEVVGESSHSLSGGGSQPSSGHGPENRRSHCPCLCLRGGKTGGEARRSILDGQEHIISQLTLVNPLPTTLRLGSFTSGGLSCGYR